MFFCKLPSTGMSSFDYYDEKTFEARLLLLSVALRACAGPPIFYLTFLK